MTTQDERESFTGPQSGLADLLTFRLADAYGRFGGHDGDGDTTDWATVVRTVIIPTLESVRDSSSGPGHTFEVECSSPHTFDDPKAVRLDGHELDPGSIVRDGFGFDFPDRGSNDPTLVRLTIACRRVEFANYLPDGSSLLWEQNTDPTDFEEDPS